MRLRTTSCAWRKPDTMSLPALPWASAKATHPRVSTLSLSSQLLFASSFSRAAVRKTVCGQACV